MSFQGFITNGETFVYQVGTLNTSAAFGLDENDFGRWKLSVSPTPGTQPSGVAQIAVDNTTPGYIELTPNGPLGQVYVNDADVNAYGAAVSTAANGFNCIKSRNYLVLDAGDTLGYFTFGGFDGTNDIQSAQIISVNPIGSTIATGRIAADMSFYTAPDNTNGPTLRAYIPITGGLEIKTPDSGNALKIDPFGVGVLLSTSAGVISSLTPGISNYVLVSNGVSSAPSWQAVPATAGVTAIAGTANEITASASTGSVTLSTPSTFIAPGSIASTTSTTVGNALTVTTGGATITAGGLTVTAGNTTLTPLNASGVVYNSSAGLLSTHATTTHAVQIGNSSGQLTSLSVGTNGQVLVGSTTADPVFATLGSSASTLTYTTGAGTLNIDITAPVAIAYGGTNATSMATTDGVCYFDGTRIVTTAVGTSTYVLTSNGAGMAPTFQAAAGGGVTSLAGTSNEITASASTGAVTLSVPSTFIAPGSIEATTTLQALSGNITATSGNVVLTAGNVTLTKANSTGTTGLIAFNSALYAYTAGGTGSIFFNDKQQLSNIGTTDTYNIGIGVGSLANLQNSTTSENIAIGHGALNNQYNTNGAVGIGYNALNLLSASYTIGIGYKAGATFEGVSSSHGYSIAMGYQAGINITGNVSADSLIYLNSPGHAGGETNTLRIGAGTGTSNQQLNQAFISGIYGISEGGTQNLVTINSSDQLGSSTTTSVTGSLSMSTTITAGTGLTVSAGGATFTTTGTNGITSVDTYGRTIGATTSPVLIDSTGLFGTIISARKYKENIQDMASASDAIYNLRPVTYNLKSDDQKTIQYGLVAEEVVDVMPRLAGYKDGELHTVHYHELPVLLLNEMQKMQKTIHAMAARIAMFEQKGS